MLRSQEKTQQIEEWNGIAWIPSNVGVNIPRDALLLKLSTGCVHLLGLLGGGHLNSRSSHRTLS